MHSITVGLFSQPGENLGTGRFAKDRAQIVNQMRQ
jgi:hypothetical protein